LDKLIPEIRTGEKSPHAVMEINTFDSRHRPQAATRDSTVMEPQRSS